MTLEELSSATASRYETKMLHDVKNSARVRSPPRPDPPMFGRESMEDAVSARASTTYEEEDDAPVPPEAETPTVVSAKAVTVEDEMEAFFTIFQRVEPQLHSFLSDADKTRIRAALKPPPPTTSMVAGVNDQAVLTIGISIILTALVFYVCRPMSSSPSLGRPGYRSTGDRTAAAPPPPPPSRRDSVVSWNIGRLLKPLNNNGSP